MSALVVLCLCVMPVMGSGAIHVAKGDPLVFEGPSAGGDQFRVWIFGYHDDIYTGAIDATSQEWFNTNIPAEAVFPLDNGNYKMYVQFNGQNKMFDMDYKNGKYISIYRSVPDIDATGLSSYLKIDKFNQMRSTQPIDDNFAEYELVVEDPEIVLTNMYTKFNGDLYIEAHTNLISGNKIDAIIDEEVYGRTEYRKMMSNKSVVFSNGETGIFWLQFPAEAAGQLTSGTHVINVHFLESGVMTIPFKRHIELITPTPTPEIKHYYDFTGDEMGYRVNTTRPAPTPTPTITVTPTPVTILAPIHLDNRTILQRGEVYIGERNLNVWGTLGWQDPETYNYEFKIRYCDGDDSIVTVKNPEHFDIDYDTFGNRLGAWCQYQSNLDEGAHAPIAFTVRSPPAAMNLTDPYFVPTVEPTPLPNSSQSYVMVGGENVSVEVTPLPIPTTEAIVVPLSPWAAMLAVVAGVVLWRK